MAGVRGRGGEAGLEGSRGEVERSVWKAFQEPRGEVCTKFWLVGVKIWTAHGL